MLGKTPLQCHIFTLADKLKKADTGQLFSVRDQGKHRVAVVLIAVNNMINIPFHRCLRLIDHKDSSSFSIILV